ncbi:hypothetical protein IDH44_25345, partial [Paenibacillus sp. IB182496]|nr:hypothetical protein [Paenibacillus sabuli]
PASAAPVAGSGDLAQPGAPGAARAALAGRDWVFVAGTFYRMRFGPDAERLWPLVEPSTFGPPERAYGHRLGPWYGGALTRARDRGAGAALPWQAGALYLRYGYEDHRRLLLHLLDRLGVRHAVETDAPEQVELCCGYTPQDELLLQLLNLSGFNGVTYREPLPIGPIRIAVRDGGLYARARLLRSGAELPLVAETQTGSLMVELPLLRDYEAIVLER